MAPAPAPAPDPATAMDVDDEGGGGGGGGGARTQNSMAVAKSEAVCTNAGPLVVDPEPLRGEGGGGDTTECSSSFGDTCSGFDSEADGGEAEVNSGMSACANGAGFSKHPRRKNVTAEWRNSVRPILWRCHWLELRIRDLSSQVSKYDRELALNKKQIELHQPLSKANGSMSESMQIHKVHRNSIMKRRKRKRHEENVDTSLYINKHQILSYYHDKQNKGAETDGLFTDDGCGSTVPIRGGLDTVTLLNSEDYDVIFEQLALRDILLTIDGVQSRVHLLQDRLNKAHSEGENLAFSEGNTHVKVARKRHHTQKSFSYTKCRYTKPQKKKNLNVLLKDDDGPAIAGKPSLPDRETDAHINDASRIANERNGECKHSGEKTITVDLLLGIGNSIPNDHIGVLCTEDIDDILIDNQAALEACQQFDEVKHLPSGTSSKDQNISAPAGMKNTCASVKLDSTCAPVEIVSAFAPVEVYRACAPVEADSACTPVEADSACTPVEVDSACTPVEVNSTCAPAVEQESILETSPSKKPVSPGNKPDLKRKRKRRKKSSFFTKKQGKEASKRPAAKEKTEGTSSAAKNQIESPPSAVAKEKAGSTPSAVAKEKAGSSPSAATRSENIITYSARKKRKSGNEPADAKKHGSGNSSSASEEQKTEKPSSSVKKQKTEISTDAMKHGSGNSSASEEQKIRKPSSAVNKQKTENSSTASEQQEAENTSSTGKKPETASAPSKLQDEKAVLAAANSRRSQRVRKPKVFAE